MGRQRIFWFGYILCLLPERHAVENPKDFKIESMVPCKDVRTPIIFEANVPNRPLTNKLLMSGAIRVTENITGPIELRIHITRCYIDMSYCVNFDLLNIQTLCSKFTEKKSFWKGFVNTFQPPLKCPITANIYRVTNGTLDLSVPARFPIDGFLWIIKFEFFEGQTTSEVETEKDNSKLLMCLDSDVTVRNSRHRSKKKSWSRNVTRSYPAKLSGRITSSTTITSSTDAVTENVDTVFDQDTEQGIFKPEAELKL